MAEGKERRRRTREPSIPVPRAQQGDPSIAIGGTADEFYRRCLSALSAAHVPHLVGGGHAYAHYTGIGRRTKDLDVFVRHDDLPAALSALSRAGEATELSFPHWLAKALSGSDHVDIIHNSGNGLAIVDDEWFAHAERGTVLGISASYCPVEEMIWSKAFVMERERFDGADALHLLRARGEKLDWARLVRRFDRYWQVLLSHLILFRFVYPSEASLVPRQLFEALLERLRTEMNHRWTGGKLCRGTLLSRAQYLVDIEDWGYIDARSAPDVKMTDENIETWTRAISDEVRTHAKHQDPTPRGRW